MTDFIRINKPRVDKIIGILDVIEKSLKSQRPDYTERTTLLNPVIDRVEDLTIDTSDIPEVTDFSQMKPKPAQCEYVEKRKLQMESMATTDIIDLMIAAGAILQDRRQ